MENGWLEDVYILYRRRMLISGFVKSTIGTSLISLGFGIMLLWAYTPNLADHTPLIGLLSIGLGFGIYYAGDLYAIAKSREIEEVRLKRASKIIDDKIEKEKDRIAQEVINTAEEEKLKIDSDLARKLLEIRDGVCSDLNTMTDEDLPYCGNVDRDSINDVMYPD